VPLQTTVAPQFLRHPNTSRAAASNVARPCEYELLTGVDAILRVQPTLVSLARRTNHAGEVDSLAYFLSTPDAVRKIPHLLLMGDPRYGTKRPIAAALLFEYRTPFGGSRVFATSDGSGRRDVLAAPEMRARTAAFAARTLLRRGAHIVHLAFCPNHLDCDDQRDLNSGALPAPYQPNENIRETVEAELHDREHPGKLEWALRELEIPAYLPLLPTYDATLARIGKKTRSNLRYYRRRSEQDLGSVFVADPNLSLADFLAFNRECTYAVSEELAIFRYVAAQTQSNHVIRGVRDANGRVLSLVGTRRQNGFVELDWQMNRADLPAYSLATVMRAYLIDHEISLGSTRLYIEGGTPQFIAGSFLRQTVSEITVLRKSHYVNLLRHFAPRVFPPKNYIGQTLRSFDLQWKPC